MTLDPTSPSPSSPSTTTLLVCDDTAAKRYVISSWLRRAGYDVIGAGSAGEALDVMASREVDLVVLDVQLPDRSGLEVAMELKASAETASIPIVHISAVAREPEHRSAGLDRGADAYLVDPIEPQELVSTVGALLRSSGARRRAESLATRLGRLHRASMHLNLASTPERLADAAASGAHLVFGGRSAAVVAGGDLGELRHGRAVVDVRHSDDSGGVGRTELAAEVLREVLAEAPVVGVVPARGAWATALGAEVSWVVSAVRSGTDVVGLVAVESELVTDQDDQRLLAELAQAVGVAAENLRAMEAEHRTALVLQRSLLPALLPPVDGLGLVGRYRAADGDAQIGGDFYDAFATDDGTAYVVIGDVQGHSLEAAVLMAELRYTLRAYAFDGHPPAAVLERVDRTLQRSQPDMTATVCLLAVDAAPDETGGRRISVANAGHLPPLLVREGAAVSIDAHGPLLGAQLGAPLPVEVVLQPGDRLLLLTDGVVERREEDLDASMDRLAAAVAQDAGSAEVLADRLMAGRSRVDDDAAIVVLDVLPR